MKPTYYSNADDTEDNDDGGGAFLIYWSLT